jgi:hypothetical protein
MASQLVSAMARPTIEAVTKDTLLEFGQFLHTHLQARRSPEAWASGLASQWAAAPPNYGFVLRDAGAIVGGIGAYYADRVVQGRAERFCNITSWCVLDAYRQQSMRLAMALIAQPGYHFTDFSPTKVVGNTLKFFKFKELDARVAVILNLPGLAPAGVQLLHRLESIRTVLPPDALKIVDAHAAFPWLQQVVVGLPGRWCHVIFKPRVFKGLPAATVLHVSDGDLFHQYFGRLSRHLLLRGFVSTHVECRALRRVPKPFAVRTGFNPKLYLSPTLNDADIDYLYSETMALDL